MSEGLHVKNPQKINVCFSKSQSFDSGQIDRGFFNLEKIICIVLALVLFTYTGQTDGRTFWFQLVQRLQNGFWLHHVLGDFFLNLATGSLDFQVDTCFLEVTLHKFLKNFQYYKKNGTNIFFPV